MSLFIVSDTFLTKLFLKIANYMPKLLREKFKIKIPFINRTVARYVDNKKMDRFDPLVLKGVRNCHQLS